MTRHHKHALVLAERDVCHGCKRDLPDGTRRLMVFSTLFDGMRQWCEDCERKGKDRLELCEHGLAVDSDCAACEALYETWRDSRDYAI